MSQEGRDSSVSKLLTQIQELSFTKEELEQVMAITLYLASEKESFRQALYNPELGPIGILKALKASTEYAKEGS